VIDPNRRIVVRLADRAGDTVIRRAIRGMQQRDIGDTQLHWPHLRTLWDEICIQVRGEESMFWDAYLEEVDTYLENEISRLPRLEQEALWLQTSAGTDWEFDDERKSADPPVFVPDIVDDLRSSLLGKADDWSNPAIRAQENADGQRYLEENL